MNHNVPEPDGFDMVFAGILTVLLLLGATYAIIVATTP